MIRKWSGRAAGIDGNNPRAARTRVTGVTRGRRAKREIEIGFRMRIVKPGSATLVWRGGYEVVTFAIVK